VRYEPKVEAPFPDIPKKNPSPRFRSSMTFPTRKKKSKRNKKNKAKRMSKKMKGTSSKKKPKSQQKRARKNEKR